MKRIVLSWLAVASAVAASPSYSIVISAAAEADPGWKEVAAALVAKYPAAKTIVWQKDVTECLPELAKQHPRFTCFVAPPAEAGLEFVRSVHRLTRKLDADAYTDTRWGILTGHDAANALEIAKESKPLVIQHTLAATEIALERCQTARTFSELVAGERVHRTADGKIVRDRGEADSVWEIAKELENPETTLFVTSAHATEHDWHPGYSYQNGHWMSKNGALFAVNLKKESYQIKSPTPKVYLPVGNCLIGHIDGPDAMALAFLKSAGVRQMIGYTLPTWYGYQGWGLLDYFVEQPGRYTLTDAFHANHHALVHRLQTYFPEVADGKIDRPGARFDQPPAIGEAAKSAKLTGQDAQGLVFDRDIVAFYGDPGWQAKLADGPLQWKMTWAQTAEGGSLVIDPQAGADSFEPVNKNGSQRGGRPMVQFFDTRIDPSSVKIIEGADHKPVITDDFILVPLPTKVDSASLKISFTAKPAA
jgi:hypothetical protein